MRQEAILYLIRKSFASSASTDAEYNFSNFNVMPLSVHLYVIL